MFDDIFINYNEDLIFIYNGVQMIYWNGKMEHGILEHFMRFRKIKMKQFYMEHLEENIFSTVLLLFTRNFIP